MKPAVFFDRDGTLNVEKGFLGDPKDVELYEGCGAALYDLQNAIDCIFIVVSNQSGITRGILTHEEVHAVNNRVNQLLAKDNVSIEKFYYCPAHPEFNSKEECICRKPSPYFVHQAAEEFSIDLSQSYFVGDKWSDVLCGINADVSSILVETGYGKEQIPVLNSQNINPNFIAKNIVNACEFIKTDSNEKSQ